MTTQTLPVKPLTGMYEQSGWTTERGIHLILKEHRRPRRKRKTTDPLDSYETITEIRRETARKLLETLPETNLNDRQNFSPTVRELLSLASEKPEEIELFGYAIGAQRPDERVSLEGFTYYPTNTTYLEQLTHWETLANTLDIRSHQAPPDAIHLVGNGSRVGIWVWWD